MVVTFIVMFTAIFIMNQSHFYMWFMMYKSGCLSTAALWEGMEIHRVALEMTWQGKVEPKLELQRP